MAINYDDYRKEMMEAGLAYQDFVVKTCIEAGFVIVQYGSRQYQFSEGESHSRVEIKFDNNYAKTGNLYIETAEKARPREGDYIPSGIFRNDNSWFLVIGDYNTIFIYGIPALRGIAGTNGHAIFEISTKTSKGFLLRGKETEILALAVLDPNAKDKVSKKNPTLMEHIRNGRDLLILLKSDARQVSLFDSNDNNDDNGGNNGSYGDDDPIINAISQ